ncbi:hypothetical protein PRK78_005063 [Emydomyces testavorans]|uniref:Histone deacetylase complex subunit SAP30 Sin3 binding domain-containing protein n=1 Tax=Emydomyces testavorans TaxID=2070801 RepID=A0AAF0DIU0_9EURO|nr:hypothetical protein PRK78_005063 [Emydomyces testavorans]
MAPPRQRLTAAAALDDTRSETSSGARERQATTNKARRAGNAAAAASKEVKPAQPAAIAGDAGQDTGENPGINWPSMPLSVLHQYRYVHNLPCPSAFSSPINSILLSRGIGLRSPTAIALRNAQRAASKIPADKPKRSPATTTTSSSSALAAKKPQGLHKSEAHRKPTAGPAHGRVSKEHLASAVRKHFNNTAISEQDAIARFVYTVSEERKGREFRLRFHP